MRVDLPQHNKTVWATGPPGLRAVAGRGPRAAGPSGDRAAGPSGRRAVGPWRAVGRWAAGPLGRGGPWAAGLLLAKPVFIKMTRMFSHFVFQVLFLADD